MKIHFMDEIRQPFLIGIAGGSGCGKSLLIRNLLQQSGSLKKKIAVLAQDAYYYDLSHLSIIEREKQNFDHPDAIDKQLMVQQVRSLITGKTILQPVYDFKQHVRTDQTIRIEPHPVILVEGILVLHYQELRSLMDVKVFIDSEPDIRLIRRLRRDRKERGRSVESVLQQYEQTVQPMHIQYVEPSKQFADVIIPDGGSNLVAIDLLKTKIEASLNP